MNAALVKLSKKGVSCCLHLVSLSLVSEGWGTCQRHAPAKEVIMLIALAIPPIPFVSANINRFLIVVLHGEGGG